MKLSSEELIRIVGDDDKVELSVRELSQLLTQADRCTPRTSSTAITGIDPWREWEVFSRRFVHERRS